MKLVIAVGGNAILNAGQKGTAKEQFENVYTTVKYLSSLAENDLVITHGNGPQVGALMIQHECAQKQIPAFPIDILDAQTQGSIGYMLTQAMGNTLKKNNISKNVATILTQVVVDKDDEAFQNPRKPVGPFYTKEVAEKYAEEKGWVIKEDAGRGYRRVVASPKPTHIVEKDIIEELLKNNNIVIATGGGGIPVVRNEDNSLSGVEAVIDKDRASSLLAKELDADIFIILTAVEKVYLNFGKPDQKSLDTITVEEAEKYMEEGHFKPGSMLPKVESIINFVKSTGRDGIITSLDKVHEALEGKTGTRIVLKK
jgi:carbamate kinase